MLNNSSHVSAVICSWNAAASIAPCIQSLRSNGVKEIILVDASSTDGTREIAEPLVDKMLTDPRQGLGAARNLGIQVSTGKYILNCGPDNIMPPGSIDGMLKYKEQGQYAGVSAITEINGSGYLCWAMNKYKKARFYPGERAVIGTPTLFDGMRLRQNSFDASKKFSDDAHLCEDWRGKFNSTFAISNIVVKELGQQTWFAVWVRWRMYGISDFEIYSSHGSKWTPARKLQSILYPLKMELIQPLRKNTLLSSIFLLPFLLIITTIRYKSWIFATIKK